MKSASMTNRAALHPVEELRELLAQLFELSAKQLEFLDGDRFAGLDELLDLKASLLEKLPKAVEVVRGQGWDWNKPATFPRDQSIASALREIGDLSRRLQAHEKYVTGQMMLHRNQVSDQLNSIGLKRCAAAGYRSLTTRGLSIDKAT